MIFNSKPELSWGKIITERDCTEIRCLFAPSRHVVCDLPLRVRVLMSDPTVETDPRKRIGSKYANQNARSLTSPHDVVAGTGKAFGGSCSRASI